MSEELATHAVSALNQTWDLEQDNNSETENFSGFETPNLFNDDSVLNSTFLTPSQSPEHAVHAQDEASNYSKLSLRSQSLLHPQVLKRTVIP